MGTLCRLCAAAGTRFAARSQGRRRPVCSNNRPFPGSTVAGDGETATADETSVGESYENGMQDDDDERVLYYRLGRWLRCPRCIVPPQTT